MTSYPKIARPRVTSIVLLSIMAIAANQTPAQQAVAQTAQKVAQKTVAQIKQVSHDLGIDIWEGGSNSLVAKAVGSAEGTRTPNGGKTQAYSGHSDPGNQVWNIGSFSYQHCDLSCTPEEADRRQFKRLKRQNEVLQVKAASRKIKLNVKATLAGIDLANQAPLAALDEGGFVERLDEAYRQGLKGDEAILQARVRSFINPRTGRLDASGLGNNFGSVTHDQGRRLDRVSDAIKAANLTGYETPK